jgi:putative tricarboxylic transport membrane protein
LGCACRFAGQLEGPGVRRLSLDTVVAAVLVIVGGVLFWDTFQWRHTPYATMASSVWPRFVLVVFFALCAIYLVRSIYKGSSDKATRSFFEWLVYYRNPLWCYGLFFLFLLTLPYLGMLIGGTLFVWGVQAAVGERTPRAQLRHAAIAIVSVGSMWLIFTYAIGVILPESSLLHL